ncbi:universal stress protein [Billgrantia desiderata]|uniref:Universal stress protein n=2 Tax=Billgrantia desiderata TaxID=52021 RepID=A0AAW4YYK2_9GAMM|nr:universal stress protein [Halomonas desiderata]MCE8011619.1 universal stress protein [Halomonas desiderata]MCE8029716.1 universal stress protein [Halomonas desiderata]MCE8053132.1 universal stress protein [Halomonas desiderata]NIC36860.1 universal stress protein [Halomonas desiderata]SEG45962.1 Nucleotide-binding universal stress protein, UspA family [Halomonas desiderata]
MTQTLLFACDLSAENRAAFARAIRLATESGARLDVIHVLDPYLPRRVLHDLEAAVVDDMQAIMTDIREDYALPEPSVMLQTVAGATYAEIVREAHDREVDMIVLGSHRKRGQNDLIIGTTLARVLRSAPCPVLSVIQPANRDWQEILLPVDFSLASRNTLREVLKRFPESHLTLLHAWDIPGEREMGSDSDYARWRDREVERLRCQLERETDQLMGELDSVPDVDLVLEQGDPLEVLVTRLRRQPPDLLALSSRGQLGRQSPITEALLAEPHCDIMLCRAW